VQLHVVHDLKLDAAKEYKQLSNFTQIGSMAHTLQLVIHAVFSMQVANIC